MTAISILLLIFGLFSFIFASFLGGDSNPPGTGRRLTHFRIANEAAEYFHESTNSYHELIQERLRLYTMLVDISNGIEGLNLESFEASLARNKENVGFCVRFHAIFLILNRFTRSDDDSTIFLGMIDGLERLEISEVPNEIVMNQFHAFSDRLIAIIREFEVSGSRTAMLAAKLKEFLDAETNLINSLSS